MGAYASGLDRHSYKVKAGGSNPPVPTGTINKYMVQNTLSPTAAGTKMGRASQRCLNCPPNRRLAQLDLWG